MAWRVGPTAARAGYWALGLVAIIAALILAMGLISA
jgi:hypothetical protein